MGRGICFTPNSISALRVYIIPDTNTLVSRTAQGLTATPDLKNCPQDVRLHLLCLDLPVLLPDFLNCFPGIVLPKGFASKDCFQAELVDGTASFKRFVSQV